MNECMELKKEVYIYGAHNIAKIAYSFMRYNGDINCFRGFVVSSKENNPDNIEGYKVIELDSIMHPERYRYIIAVPSKYISEIKSCLELKGVGDIVEWDINDAERMIRQKTNDIFSKCNNDRLYLLDDPADETYMELFREEDKNITNNRMKYKVLPYAIVPFYDENDHVVENFSFKNDYEKTFGEYRHISSLHVTNKEVSDKDSFDIYMICSHMDKLARGASDNTFLIPIQAGAALTDIKKCEIRDNVGDNISERNKTMAEMTAIYWVWKNAKKPRYVGICHYRRQFIIDEDEYSAILNNDVDVVLNVPRFVLPSVIGQFERGIGVDEKDKEMMLNIIRHKYSDYYDCAVAHINQPLFYSCNMMIAKREVFDDYCEFSFNILMEFDDYCRMHVEKMDIKFTAYWAEIITSIYFAYNKDKYKVAVADFRLFTVSGDGQ